MLKITKGNVKPIFYEMRKRYDGNYDNMVSADKDTIKEILIAEQHRRCAYCMCRIEIDSSTIEHYIPRSVDRNLSLDYRNLFAVCDKTKKSPRDMQTCDTHGGNITLHIDPRQQNDIDTIFYTHGGYIHSANENFESDLSETLNLNSKILVNCRAKAIAALEKRSSRHHDKSWTKKQVKKFLDKLESEDDDTEYAGYLIYMLKKRLNRS